MHPGGAMPASPQEEQVKSSEVPIGTREKGNRSAGLHLLLVSELSENVPLTVVCTRLPDRGEPGNQAGREVFFSKPVTEHLFREPCLHQVGENGQIVRGTTEKRLQPPTL